MSLETDLRPPEHLGGLFVSRGGVMARHPCSYCGTPTPRGGVCPKTGCAGHRRRPRDQRTITEQGLGADHRRLGTQALLAAGADEHGIGGVCAVCGGPGTQADPLERGHIVPRSKGGQNVAENYRAEHASHQRREGALLGGYGRKAFDS